MAAHLDEFERSTTEITNHPVRLPNPRNNTQRREMRFPLARNQLNRHTADGLSLGEELGAIFSVPCCGGRNHLEINRPGLLSQAAKTAQRPQRLGDRLISQPAGACEGFSQAAHRLFVEDRRQRPRQPLIDDKTDRIRADVDNRYRLAVWQATGCKFIG